MVKRQPHSTDFKPGPSATESQSLSVAILSSRMLMHMLTSAKGKDQELQDLLKRVSDTYRRRFSHIGAAIDYHKLSDDHGSQWSALVNRLERIQNLLKNAGEKTRSDATCSLESAVQDLRWKLIDALRIIRKPQSGD